MWLLIAFIAVPVLEIALFIQVGGFLGLWPTLLIVILTAILGTYLVRSQGILAMSQLRGSFSEMRDPTEPLVHGAMILFSGALLLTPGFFTDAVGFAFLVPAIRGAAYRAIRARVNIQSFQSTGAAHPQHRPGRDDVIDVEYEEIFDNDTGSTDVGPKGSSGWTKH